MTKGLLCGALTIAAFAAFPAETVVTENKTAGGMKGCTLLIK